MTTTPMTLEAHASTRAPRNGPPAWCEQLPDEIKDQIRASHLGDSAVLHWLVDIGYEDATLAKIVKWRARPGNKPRASIGTESVTK